MASRREAFKSATAVTFGAAFVPEAAFVPKAANAAVVGSSQPPALLGLSVDDDSSPYSVFAEGPTSLFVASDIGTLDAFKNVLLQFPGWINTGQWVQLKSQFTANYNPVVSASTNLAGTNSAKVSAKNALISSMNLLSTVINSKNVQQSLSQTATTKSKLDAFITLVA